MPEPRTELGTAFQQHDALPVGYLRRQPKHKKWNVVVLVVLLDVGLQTEAGVEDRLAHEAFVLHVKLTVHLMLQQQIHILLQESGKQGEYFRLL